MNHSYESGEFSIFPAKILKGLSPSKQTIMAWLVYHRNQETGDCYPSIETLCAETGIRSRTTVTKCLRELEEDGFIKSVRRYREDGGLTSNMYEVFIKRVSPCSNETLPLEQELDSNHKKINHKNTNIDFSSNTIKASVSLNGKVPPDFERCWEAYGKKTGRPAALRYWSKLSAKAKKEIEAAIPAYVASTPDKKFRKNFSGWINPANEMWKDEVLGVVSPSEDISLV